MWRLRLQRQHARRVREHGAVAVIVSILVASGVIMGTLAISVDVGQIMSERRQLQNGADASAYALARLCAKGDAACSAAGAASAVKPLADANAKDGLSSIESVCIKNVTGSDLPPCDTSSATDAQDLAKCNPIPSTSAAVKYVEVKTRTQTTAGNTVLTPFARALAGGGSSGTSVVSCARAGWGPAGNTGNTLPLVMGYCDWANATATGTKYAPSPPYTPAPGTSSTNLPTAISSGGYPVAILAHSNADNTSDTCGVNANGGYYPGGFGWTAASEPCQATFDSTGTVSGDTGSLPNPCKDNNDLNNFLGKETAIPIAISATGSGSSATFTLSGIAKFFVAGFVKVSAAQPSQSAAVYKEPNTVCTGKCNGSVTYFWGWFTSGLLPVGTSIDPGGQSLGADVVGYLG